MNMAEKCINIPETYVENEFHLDAEGFLWFKNRIYIPK